MRDDWDTLSLYVTGETKKNYIVGMEGKLV